MVPGRHSVIGPNSLNMLVSAKRRTIAIDTRDAIGEHSGRREIVVRASCVPRHVCFCLSQCAFHRKADCTDPSAYHCIDRKACSSWLTLRTCLAWKNTSTAVRARCLLAITAAFANKKVPQRENVQLLMIKCRPVHTFKQPS